MGTQNYELAFHVVPTIEELKIAEVKQELESFITSKGGAISYSKEPQRMRLSYSIKHQTHAYFSYIHFNLSNPEDSIKELNDYLKLNNDILRYLILRMPSDLQKGKDMLKQLKMRERAEKRPKAAPKQVSEKEEKEMEKQLEDIIEKL